MFPWLLDTKENKHFAAILDSQVHPLDLRLTYLLPE